MKGKYIMNTGKTCKNLTDGLLVFVAILALIGVIVHFVGFEEEYKMKHPSTKEEITVSAPFDDPYAETYLKLFGAFSAAAIIGFASRKKGWLSIVASVCAFVISINYYMDGLIEENGYAYLGIAAASIAGSVIYTYYYYTEVKKTLPPKEKKKKKEKNEQTEEGVEEPSSEEEVQE